MISRAKSILKETFGYEDFRLQQEQAITQVLQKKDALVIMPTGGGKSNPGAYVRRVDDRCFSSDIFDERSSGAA